MEVRFMRHTKNKKFVNSLLPLCAFGVLILIVSLILKIVPDGADRESREALLRNMDRGQEWSITEETELEDHLLATVSAKATDGLALFRPVGDGYTCTAFETGKDGEVIRVHSKVNETPYDCFHLDRVDAYRLEVLYNDQTEPMKFFCEAGNFFWISAPDGDYSIRVTYYDAQDQVIGQYEG
jgi:hypothetical protein